jgi:hypothetical protein
MLLERGWCGTVEGPGTTEGRAVASAALRHKDCRKGKLCLDKLVLV